MFRSVRVSDSEQIPTASNIVFWKTAARAGAAQERPSDETNFRNAPDGNPLAADAAAPVANDRMSQGETPGNSISTHVSPPTRDDALPDFLTRINGFDAVETPETGMARALAQVGLGTSIIYRRACLSGRSFTSYCFQHKDAMFGLCGVLTGFLILSGDADFRALQASAHTIDTHNSLDVPVMTGGAALLAGHEFVDAPAPVQPFQVQDEAVMRIAALHAQSLGEHDVLPDAERPSPPALIIGSVPAALKVIASIDSASAYSEVIHATDVTEQRQEPVDANEDVRSNRPVIAPAKGTQKRASGVRSKSAVLRSATVKASSDRAIRKKASKAMMQFKAPGLMSAATKANNLRTAARSKYKKVVAAPQSVRAKPFVAARTLDEALSNSYGQQ